MQDGWTVGQTDGGSDKQTNGQTDRQTDGRTLWNRWATSYKKKSEDCLLPWTEWPVGANFRYTGSDGTRKLGSRMKIQIAQWIILAGVEKVFFPICIITCFLIMRDAQMRSERDSNLSLNLSLNSNESSGTHLSREYSSFSHPANLRRNSIFPLRSPAGKRTRLAWKPAARPA